MTEESNCVFYERGKCAAKLNMFNHMIRLFTKATVFANMMKFDDFMAGPWNDDQNIDLICSLRK